MNFFTDEIGQSVKRPAVRHLAKREEINPPKAGGLSFKNRIPRAGEADERDLLPLLPDSRKEGMSAASLHRTIGDDDIEADIRHEVERVGGRDRDLDKDIAVIFQATADPVKEEGVLEHAENRNGPMQRYRKMCRTGIGPMIFSGIFQMFHSCHLLTIRLAQSPKKVQGVNARGFLHCYHEPGGFRGLVFRQRIRCDIGSVLHPRTGARQPVFEPMEALPERLHGMSVSPFFH